MLTILSAVLLCSDGWCGNVRLLDLLLSVDDDPCDCCDQVPGLDWLQSGVEDTLGSGVGGFLPLARGPISDIGA